MSPGRASRQVRRALARQAKRHARRQAVHRALPDPIVPTGPATSQEPGGYDSVVGWLDQALAGRGHSRPARKRLAVLGASRLASGGERGTPAGITRAAFRLGIGTATQEASVARRVERLLDDPHLEPQRLLPDLTQAWRPVRLATVIRAHAQTIGTTAPHASHPTGHHGRWIGVRLVLDESSLRDGTHLLVVGLAYRGILLPLARRPWPQNAPLPEGAYWQAVRSLLCEVAAALPPVLRAHVVVLADRAYGVPAFLDHLTALGWHFVIRVQGHVTVRLPDGTERPLHTLVPRPGTLWTGFHTAGSDASAPGSTPAPGTTLVAVFKKAGWRTRHVVATWAPGQAEPWLLVSTLPATPTRWRDYAERWMIEVTFFLLKGLLGFDEPQNQTPLAVRRTAPFAGFVFALIVLWYATELQAGRVATWTARPWYPRKAAPSFADVLATLRHAGTADAARWHPPVGFLTPPCPPRRHLNIRLRRHAFRYAPA